MRDNAAAEESVFERTFCAIEELIGQDDVAGFVFRLEGSNRAHADDPLRPELFHSPDVGAMIEFTRENAMASTVPWKENDFTPGKFAREEIVGRNTKRSFYFNPLLFCKTFDVIQPAAADDSDSILLHRREYEKPGWELLFEILHPGQ